MSKKPQKNMSRQGALYLSICSLALAGASFYWSFLYEKSSVIVSVWNVANFPAGPALVVDDSDPRLILGLSADFVFANVGTVPVVVTEVRLLLVVDKKNLKFSENSFTLCNKLLQHTGIATEKAVSAGYSVIDGDNELEGPFIVEAGKAHKLKLRLNNWIVADEIRYYDSHYVNPEHEFLRCLKFTSLDANGYKYEQIWGGGMLSARPYDVDGVLHISATMKEGSSTDLLDGDRSKH